MRRLAHERHADRRNIFNFSFVDGDARATNCFAGSRRVPLTQGWYGERMTTYSGERRCHSLKVFLRIQREKSKAGLSALATL
jgi:hypothetical protein